MNSIWPPELASLDDALALPCETLGKLDAAVPIDVAKVVEHLRTAADSAQLVRELVASELPEATWQTRTQLDAHIETIRKIVDARNVAKTRTRLVALAAELERGSIVHRRALRVTELNQLRDQAVSTLRSQAEAEAPPPSLPGPEADQWIEWACGLKEPEDSESLEALRHGFAQLDDFVANLEPGMWSVPDPALQNEAELRALLEEEARKNLRLRLSDLATELERGSIVHHRASRVSQLNQLRDQAVQELRSQAEGTGNPPTLPGPEPDQWVAWACALKEPEDAESLQTLRDGFAQLDDFVASLEPDMWKAGGGSPTPEIVPEVLPQVDKTPGNGQPKQTPPDRNGFEETILSSGPLPIKLKTGKSSGRGHKWRASNALNQPSTQGFRSATLAPEEPVPAAAVPHEVPIQKDAVVPSMKGLVAEPVGRLKQVVEPAVTKEAFRETSPALVTSSHPEPHFKSEVFRGTDHPAKSDDFKTRMTELWERNPRLLIGVAALVLLLVIGIFWWRSRRNQALQAAAKANESQAAAVVPPPADSSQYQSALPIDVNKQAADKKAKDQAAAAAAAKTPAPGTPAQPAGKPDAGVLQPPLAVAKNAPKTQEVASNAPETAPDLGSLPRNGSVPTTLINGISVAQPKLAQKITVSSGVAQGLLVHQVTPKYPPQARQARVQGTVVLQALIGKDGSVRNLHAVSGPPLLTQAAVDAVKQWRYKPYYLDGQPVEAETQINVKFTP